MRDVSLSQLKKKKTSKL